VGRVRDRLGVVGALLAFMWQQKQWWLIPATLCLLLVAVLAVLGASSPLAPFIYPLF
jgi:phosphatidylglycerophosphate synthase